MRAAFLAAALLLGAAAVADAPPAGDPDWHIAAAPAAADPSNAEYLRLADALARYRALEARGGWVQLEPGEPLRVGMRDARVEELRNRLRAGGDYTAEMGADPWFFDWALDQAVRRLQRRHGLAENGVFDDAALDAANVPVEELIDRISATMERWRWLPRDLGRRYVWVNIPRARLDVMEDGRSTMAMRVVVGHRERPTPSLSGELSRVVFNPTWSVPRTIAVEDLLPRQVEDPTFFDRLKMRVYRGDPPAVVDARSVDWRKLGADRFPYRLVQEAGPGNSLGRIRLSFDNPWDIYLHDSPARGMFGLDTRALSSGCVRLEDAPALATLLLSNDREWSDRATQEAIDAGRTRTINLKRRLPVYLVYLTVWTEPDGEIRFGRDIYGRDERLISSSEPSS